MTPPSLSPSKVGLTADDYKIIRFEPGYVTCVYVYSLRRDSWRQVIVNFTPGYAHAYKGICVDGAIHWLWSEDPNVFGSYIAAFDLETESMRSIPLPKKFLLMVQYTGYGSCSILKNFGGRLCVCDKSPIDGSTVLWVMEEYGVKTSWTALFHIESSIVPFGYFPAWDDARLLCFGLGSKSWLWLNTQDGSKKNIQIQRLPRGGYIRYEIESWICDRSPLHLDLDVQSNLQDD